MGEIVDETENKVGRPTKYKPEFCQKLIEHMSTGLSYESFASVAGVNRSVLYDWESVFPEFLEAKEAAFGQCLLFWEQAGIDGLYNTVEMDENGKAIKSKALNATIWIFNMKNRFKWRDRQADESDVVINNNNNNLATQTDAELDAQIAEKMKKLMSSNES